jgi:hypothetical protein
MHIKHVTRMAEALVFAHGVHARDEALRMADLCERTGDMELATDWRKTLAAMPVAKAGDYRAAA